MSYEQEKSTAITAVARAAALCTMVRTEMVSVASLEKGDNSPVTVADFGAQALICRHLATAFPEDPIVGEEDSAQLQEPANRQNLEQVTRYVQRFHPEVTPATVCRWIDAGNGQVGPRYWTLDPIDGTKGFLRDDQYAIALALVEAGEIKVGVLACPALPMRLEEPDGEPGVLFVAVRGQGATMAPLSGGPATPIQAASETDSAGLTLVESVESAHGNHARQQAVAEIVGIQPPSVRMDSQAKYGLVARGEAALYLRLPASAASPYREKIWDHAAGALLVSEAGGRVTDMHGRPLDFGSGARMLSNQGVVVSNGPLHSAVLEALAQTAS